MNCVTCAKSVAQFATTLLALLADAVNQDIAFIADDGGRANADVDTVAGADPKLALCPIHLHRYRRYGQELRLAWIEPTGLDIEHHPALHALRIHAGCGLRVGFEPI